MGETFTDMILDFSQKAPTDCAMLDNTVLAKIPFLIVPKILVKKARSTIFLFPFFSSEIVKLFLIVQVHLV